MLFSKIKNLFRDNHSEYIDRLVAAFPTELRENVKEVTKIIPFSRNPIRLADGNEHLVNKFVSDDKPQQFNLRGEIVKIPRRVYFEQPESDVLETLPNQQLTIINCIYLRHHNGFIREKHLIRLLKTEDYFVCPFVIQILGEYVVELISILDQEITDQNISTYAEFLNDNLFFWKQTQSRIVSYWDVYYRYKFPNLRDYVSQRLSNKLNNALKDF